MPACLPACINILAKMLAQTWVQAGADIDIDMGFAYIIQDSIYHLGP